MESRMFRLLADFWVGRGVRPALSLFLLTSRLANITGSFDPFAPGSRGKYRFLAEQTIETVRSLPRVLSQLAKFTGGDLGKPESLATWGIRAGEKRSAQLGALFNAYGSDKTRHGYHYVYAAILQRSSNQKLILEVGLGTNNVDVVSHMGANGQPGASLRAFRDYCPSAQL